MPAMRRATGVRSAGTWQAPAADSVVLDQQSRHRRRIALDTISGGRVLLDLPRPVRLREGDALACDDGALILVRAADEPVMDLGAPDPVVLVRIAWHLGNRHLPVQVLPAGLRIRADHVIADMVRGLGGTVTEREAPFDPEPGAYAGGHHHHHHHDGGDEDDGRAAVPAGLAGDHDRGA